MGKTIRNRPGNGKLHSQSLQPALGQRPKILTGQSHWAGENANTTPNVLFWGTKEKSQLRLAQDDKLRAALPSCTLRDLNAYLKKKMACWQDFEEAQLSSTDWTAQYAWYIRRSTKFWSSAPQPQPKTTTTDRSAGKFFTNASRKSAPPPNHTSS